MSHPLDRAFERQVHPLLRRSILKRFFGIPQFVEVLRALPDPPTFSELNRLLGVSTHVEQAHHLDLPGGAVLVANHPYAMLDLFCLCAAAEVHRTGPVRAVVDSVSDDLVELHPLMTFVGATPAERESFWSDNEALLRSGGTVVIFPAGFTHHRRRGHVVETDWRGGALKLAARSEVPVVPAWITMRSRTPYNFLKARLPRETVRKLNLRHALHGPSVVPIRFGAPLEPANLTPNGLRDRVYALGASSYTV